MLFFALMRLALSVQQNNIPAELFLAFTLLSFTVRRCTVKLKNAKQSSINTCYVNIKHKKVNIFVVLATKSFTKYYF